MVSLTTLTNLAMSFAPFRCDGPKTFDGKSPVLVLERNESAADLRSCGHFVRVRNLIARTRERFDDGRFTETVGVLSQQSQDVAAQIFFVHGLASLGTSGPLLSRLVSSSDTAP